MRKINKKYKKTFKGAAKSAAPRSAADAARIAGVKMQLIRAITALEGDIRDLGF